MILPPLGSTEPAHTLHRLFHELTTGPNPYSTDDPDFYERLAADYDPRAAYDDGYREGQADAEYEYKDKPTYDDGYDAGRYDLAADVRCILYDTLPAEDDTDAEPVYAALVSALEAILP